MATIDLPTLFPPVNRDVQFGVPITPIDRLKVISSDDFEDMVMEWAVDYLKKIKGLDVQCIEKRGGPGDKGRDIIVWKDKNTKAAEYIYQCKHYADSLPFANILLEIGKIVYFSFEGDFLWPENYVFIASSGLTNDAKDALLNPTLLKGKLLKEWNKKCKKRISSSKEVPLSKELKAYIDSLDFTVVKNIDPQAFLDQYAQTTYFKFRFGGGFTKAPTLDVPVKEDYSALYIRELFAAYSDHIKKPVGDLLHLRGYPELGEHFTRSRQDFYYADSLRQFSKDQDPDGMDMFGDIKRQVHDGVIDIVNNDHVDAYKRVKEVTTHATVLPIASPLKDFIEPAHKKGICHHLVNDEEIKWLKS